MMLQARKLSQSKYKEYKTAQKNKKDEWKRRKEEEKEETEKQ